MSVVKVVKRRKVILEALADEPRKKSQCWNQKEQLLREVGGGCFLVVLLLDLCSNSI